MLHRVALRCVVRRAVRPARVIIARPVAVRFFATEGKEGKKPEVKRAASAPAESKRAPEAKRAAAAPAQQQQQQQAKPQQAQQSQQASTGPKKLTKEQQDKAKAQADENKSDSTLDLLRAAVPVRKANASALFDPPYPRNPLGEAGLPAIQLFKEVKAAGIDPQEVSKQLDAFQKALDTDVDLALMIRTPASSEDTKKPAGSGAQFPFMQNRPAVPPPSGNKVTGLTANKAQREAKFQQVFKQLNISKPVQNFIMGLVNEKGAISDLKSLQALFNELIRYDRNEVLVRIKTAEPLSKDQSKKLRTKLSASASSGQKLVFEEDVDPKLLGGLVIFFGNKMQDLSSLSKVRSLQKLLQAQAV